MEDTLLLGAASAFWLGILTSISPCPLATNIAAVSFIGRQFDRAPKVAFSGLSYVLGRMLAYAGIGGLLVAGLLTAPALSGFLQKHMNRILGPLLVLVGMVLLDLLRVSFPGGGVSGRMQARAERGGIWGAGVLGFVFALSLCPISAALFFGSLVPLSVRHGSPVLFPLLYGVGTGLPVLVLAGMIAAGARSIGAVFRELSRVERWARRITGIVFIGAGIHFTLRYVFELY